MTRLQFTSRCWPWRYLASRCWRLTEMRMSDMTEREEMLAWAKRVGEYRLGPILEKFDSFRKTMREKAASEARAAATRGEGNSDER